ncbi:tRNA-binding protein [Elizabethkingia anophelis]|uniref:Protein secretion chaperonin CsaA n=3 Tax=Elizabethkingia anophelis TaxID=1117645 RepID=A0A077EG27_9FLAO|nr:tRNA-binding protein [Elizabethkingia anophelis]AIL45084.1 Protein secretion chaperonin CsaA [Elizabethkingia anophelis NUHP1]AQW96113.1 tRNA-binding protein [Elizabethkingia anophelis]AQX02534.1 tRNA-binding protein [Elizabethkingia anophelis]ATC37985.1 tRNA-binding protein [Elizabethkingia anophelis R26]ATC41664.1 tRNA-binding protein [Elizabethkingia anophelis Ag1]
MDIKPEITWSDFEKIDMRVGTIISAVVFEKARKPAYQLEIDFGDLGMRKSSAQITDLYNTETLVGQQIIAVVNFPKKQIANFFSECLVLGIVGTNQVITLLQPEQKTTNGLPIA